MSSTAKRLYRPSGSNEITVTQQDDILFAQLGITTKANSDPVAAVRRGLPVRVLDRLAKALGVSQRRLLQLIALPQATFARRRAAKRLSPQESDRVYRIATVYRDVLALFEGDEGAARDWLSSPAVGLGGQIPLDLLDTAAGADRVRTLIGRLEHGIVA